MELVFGVLLTLTAAVVGVWHIASRDRPLHGPADDGTLGLPHLQRWSDRQRKRRFSRLREGLPLVDGARVLIVGGLVVGVAVAAAGGVLLWRVMSGHQSANVDGRLGEIVTLHARANASADHATRYALLVQAEEAASELLTRSSDSDREAIEAEYRSIVDDLDRLTQMTRLERVQPIGSIPAASSPALPRLFQGGGRTYLLSDALYEVDVTTFDLVRLLQPGDTVNGVTVGELVGGVWRGDGPLVLDDARAYTYDHARGEWNWETLGATDVESGPVGVSSVGSFDLNLYVLDGVGGRILRYAGGDYESKPEDWAAGVAAEELRRASDIAVDGNIYALLPDGSILRFFLNRPEALLSPQIRPEFDSAVALTQTASGFYIVNGSDGRVARVSADGVLERQFRSNDDTAVLAGLRDVVVDESTGIALLLTADSLYTTRLVDLGS